MRHFYVLEGPDGAGTTTQMKAVAERLGCLTTNEPTSGKTGKLLRRCLSGEIDVPKSTMAYLFAADRYEHIYGPGGVKEMTEDHIVLCDRYLYSSLAYQGDEELLPLVMDLNRNFPEPEIVFFLDVPPEESMRRIGQRNGKKEIYENLEYLKAVRERYYDVFLGKISQFFSDAKVVRIDGMKSKEEITSIIVMEIQNNVLKRS